MQERGNFELQDLEPGVKGRIIPPEELVIRKEGVEELARMVGGGAFGEWVRKLYKPYIDKPFGTSEDDPRKFFNFFASLGEKILTLQDKITGQTTK
jgi:hypothetical protein